MSMCIPLATFVTLPQGTARLTFLIGRPFKLRLELPERSYELTTRAVAELILAHGRPEAAAAMIPANDVRG